ncbi:hypothetical protein HS088_TW10G00239 [Tripterygium wilfordii]|uniref:Uncharacterized protein n=1 Tax=Tripterygium wilfordii TaxID=458696 RepID=A0A7J7D4J5_TRIWF|nr:hypothetical protein HS088_TW10G00239 [Tripterygium wilfordii]
MRFFWVRGKQLQRKVCNLYLALLGNKWSKPIPNLQIFCVMHSKDPQQTLPGNSWFLLLSFNHASLSILSVGIDTSDCTFLIQLLFMHGFVYYFYELLTRQWHRHIESQLGRYHPLSPTL